MVGEGAKAEIARLKRTADRLQRIVHEQERDHRALCLKLAAESHPAQTTSQTSLQIIQRAEAFAAFVLQGASAEKSDG